MTPLMVDTVETRNNPLDVLEELVDANEWQFDRNSAEEMMVELKGRWSDYRLYFVWQEDLSAISFSCIVDLRVPSHRRPAFLELLGGVNEKLWLGHFDLCIDEPVPMFRHTVLQRDTCEKFRLSSHHERSFAQAAAARRLRQNGRRHAARLAGARLGGAQCGRGRTLARGPR